ncbi:hypothetical protein [Pseudophaeobacter sp.]|uniref:hypothetical protein n=1 Tax=Pseudophaeobacter sp. TaxID=1971739 RepID=UPI0040580E00
MAQPPFSYPGDDDTPYLKHFEGKFASVFVTLNPFLSISGHAPYKNGDSIPDSVVHAAKLAGPSCGVSWQEIAELCGFPSIGHVNRALRLTGSKRISAKYANQDETDRMLNVCASQGIYPPGEGYASPLLELAMGAFARDLCQENLINAGPFGSFPKTLQNSDLPEKHQDCDWVELWTPDHSLYCSIDIDYHYYLICQTDESLKRAKPHAYFEGFYADTETSDLWGIGGLAPV